jgi:hypothetical protein
MSDRWIVVRNWDKFQHYKDRAPAWIKLYTELSGRDDWLDLPFTERGLLVTIWIEYARSGGQLKVSGLSARGHDRVRGRSLQRLNDAGFIEFSASRPLALRARAKEKEKEKEKKEGFQKTVEKRRGPKTGWREVRGSHGLDYIPDPNGRDRPPYSVPELRGMDS